MSPIGSSKVAGVLRRVACLGIFAAGLLPAGAHPGHSLTEVAPSHWVTSPDHAVVLVGSGIALWLGTRALREGRSRRWAEVMAVALICGAGVQWGLGR